MLLEEGGTQKEKDKTGWKFGSIGPEEGMSGTSKELHGPEGGGCQLQLKLKNRAKRVS